MENLLYRILPSSRFAFRSKDDGFVNVKHHVLLGLIDELTNQFSKVPFFREQLTSASGNLLHSLEWVSIFCTEQSMISSIKQSIEDSRIMIQRLLKEDEFYKDIKKKYEKLRQERKDSVKQLQSLKDSNLFKGNVPGRKRLISIIKERKNEL